jgi:hypothetical protein
MAASLNVFQRLIRHWETVHPYNAAQAMTVRCAVDQATADRAWGMALSVLGLGKVRVSGQSVAYEHLNGELVRFGVRFLPAGTCLETHLGQGLNEPFDDPDEPPFRPFILQGPDSCQIGVVYRHWVADSVSVRLLLREWFAWMFDEKLARNRPLRKAARGYWELFSGRIRLDETALGLFRSHMRFRRVLKIHTPGKTGYDVSVALHDPPDGIAQALRLAARRRDSTVGDLLLASLAEACNRHLPMQQRPTRRDLSVGSIIDLRPHTRRHLHDTFGLYLGFTHCFCKPADLGDWSRLVRSVGMQRRAHTKGGVGAYSAAWMTAALATQRLCDPSRLYHFYRKEMPLTAGLSNVNLHGTWAERLHPHLLENYVRVSPTGPMCPLVLSATTLGEKLRLAMTYRHDLVPRATATAFLQSVVRRLCAEAGMA